MSVMYHDKRCRLAILIFDNMKYYLLYKRVGLGILAIGNGRVYCTCCQETFFGYHSLDVLFRSCNITHLLYFYSIHLTSYPRRTTTQEKEEMCNVWKLSSSAKFYFALFFRQAYILSFWLKRRKFVQCRHLNRYIKVPIYPITYNMSSYIIQYH